MIVLDTNVVSELMREHPHAVVDRWVRSQPKEELAISSITIAEVLYGIGLLPSGRRRLELERGWQSFSARGFAAAALPFDAAAAECYARIVIDRRATGRPIDALDAMIASIALARGADVATRDISGFEGCGVRLINPWK